MSGAAVADQGPGEAAAWKPRANPWLIAIVVTLAAFMEVLDTTIVNVALPHIAGAMSSSNDESTWTLTSYLVANSIVLPISGWFARIIGRKRYFLICIAMFTLASFLCGIAGSLWQLILFRLIQGFFGGGLQPNQQSIVLDTFEPAKRGAAFGVVAIATVIAPVMGPTVGGWLTDNFSWQWIFLINVPVGIFTFFAVAALVEDPPWLAREQKGERNVDYIGLSLITIGFGCLQVVMDRGEDLDWFGSGFIRLFSLLAFIGLVGAVFWLLHARNPVVNIRVMADRNFSIGCLTIFLMAMVLYSSAVLLPQLVQTRLGYTATWAGLMLMPGSLVVPVLIPLVGRLMKYVQTRFVIMLGFALLGLALVYSHHITPDIDFRTLMMMRAAQTVGLAFLFVPISTVTYITLPKEQNADGAALFTMFRNLAGSIGISAATALVTERSQVRMAHLQPHMTPLEQPYVDYLQHVQQGLVNLGTNAGEAMQQAAGIAYQTLQQQAAILAYMDIFGMTAILSFATIPVCFLFSSTKGGGGMPGH
ncbi:Multidrug resistance protein B [Granulibacter bethesdensis]|uniref:Multidrug resistance protein B n=1 Tax=Granulibacter bethesdensis TaxID=364410 RepID=A0AAC9P999_9PROT|nr:DHA2 family efflux MFS transporter permease subunit [Granulibacter bethesdensis]APH55025.1 Multidrug resistance protein B [Granulibacter bethesdensis]APH62611.1 Multidrug resistance protein B [Granulibacter bethesdensis]